MSDNSRTIFTMKKFILLILALLQPMSATMVGHATHVCPLCGTVSITDQLLSYSQFGEPARDLSDSPVNAFASIDVCPHDLFANGDSWEKLNQPEKDQLSAFLKNPVLILTAQEKVVMGDKLPELRESNIMHYLWARTCNAHSPANPKRDFELTMSLYYRCNFGPLDKPEPWVIKLATLYRENAIIALKDAKVATWASPSEKRIYAYLEAEFTRLAGRDADAWEMFQKIIAAEEKMKPEDEIAWIAAWSKEQSLRASKEAKDPAKLAEMLIPSMPDPWRDRKITTDKRWWKHRVAVDVLASQAIAGDSASSQILWKFLERKPERLLALLETTNQPMVMLRNADASWGVWFDEIAKILDDGKLPSPLNKDPNETRVSNSLRDVVGTFDDGIISHEKIVIPAVRKAAKNGKIPQILIHKDDGPLAPLPGQEDEKQKGPRQVNDIEMARLLYEVWEDATPDLRHDLATVYMLLLQRLDEDDEMLEYPLAYFLPAIADQEFGREVLRNAVQQKWKSSFLRAACAYAAKIPESSSELLNHPFLQKNDNDLVFKLLAQQSDPVWITKAHQKLVNDPSWCSYDAVNYLVSLDDPKAKAALSDIDREIRSQIEKKKPGYEGKLPALKMLDRAFIRSKMLNLPIR